MYSVESFIVTCSSTVAPELLIQRQCGTERRKNWQKEIHIADPRPASAFLGQSERLSEYGEIRGANRKNFGAYLCNLGPFLKLQVVDTFAREELSCNSRPA